MAQPIRIPVKMFAKLTGDVDPNTAVIAVDNDGKGHECSAPIPCYGLVNKVVELFDNTVGDFAAHPITIQGTIIEEGSKGSPAWLDLPAPGNTINANGIIPIILVHPALATIPVEPELTYLRILGTDAGGGRLPRFLQARLAGLWLGVEPWHKRIRDDYGI